ncbi:metalloregulator ArsR/SmtB family transcription factor [Cellulomonas sp. 73-92]|uniref:metalloregulator ArsR/SmtB family transcription factor n=1 Tax=Cellulomonas sp. 73-92 TaxID=1895740 RepID=UPI0025C57093|nr:metalloregulator ArsR/SmtB family transcription factor [Cellulomonas sp. 73-92]
MKALGNGRRLELLELLAQGEHSVEDLARMSGMALTTTSAHLQRLKAASLVRTRRERTKIYYRLAGDDVAELFVTATRVGLARSPQLREIAQRYLTVADAPNDRSTIMPTAIDSGATIIDVRPAHEFAGGHLPGAWSIPLADLGDRTGEIPAGQPVVLYCRGALCRLARQAAHQLREQGFDAVAMDEGVLEWRARGSAALEGAA